MISAGTVGQHAGGNAMTTTTTVDEYLAALPDAQRAALERIRETIRAAAPDATETISYGIPTFKEAGRLLLSYAAFTSHCSLFPASGMVMAELGDELRTYLSGKATLRFAPDRPISAELVRKIVLVRLAEVDPG
jgi:uncharacterized protein YdhG (YjbR/CyaY superfamily)